MAPAGAPTSGAASKDGGAALPEAQVWDSGEETWARAFSEMAVFQMYGNPSGLYTGSDKGHR